MPNDSYLLCSLAYVLQTMVTPSLGRCMCTMHQKDARVVVTSWQCDACMQPTKATGTADFNPAQWLDATGTAAVPNDGPGNLAWGGGPRRCAGQNLATVELITSLAILGREVQRFEIPPEKNDHDYFSTQTHPTGCPATIIPRS